MPGRAYNFKKSGSNRTKKNGVQFLTNLTRAAAFCRENDAVQQFTQLILSIPIGDSTNTNRRDRQIARKDIRNRNRDKKRRPRNNSNTANSTKCAETSRSKNERKSTHNEWKRAASEIRKSILEERVQHKIVFNGWMKMLTKISDASVPCEVNYSGSYSKEHTVDYRIRTQKNTKVFNKKTVGNADLSKNSHMFLSRGESVEKHKELNAQMKVNNVRRNDDQRAVDVLKIQQFCRECDRYVEVSLYHSHVAGHRQTQEEHQAQTPILLVPYEQGPDCAEPAARLAFEDIPSDGNCFFFSIIKLLNLSTTPSEMRRRLLASPFVESCLHPEGVRSILRSETEYVEVDCIYLFCKAYDKNACIHYVYYNAATQTEVIQYCHFRINSSPSFLHLRLQNQHYIPLIDVVV